jgi:DNA-binding response OmpR family regulator
MPALLGEARAARVLVADDDPSILRLLQVNFRIEGFEVETATHGEEVLPAAKRFAPDVVVLDVMMPGVDGWEVCRRLREDEQTAGIPVVFLSARAQDEDRERSRALEAEYVTKPFEPSHLTDLVKRLAEARP